MQYNTNNRLAPLTAPLGPWPFDIGQKRVTDETRGGRPAVLPKHPALTDAQRDRPARLRGLGAGARPLLRRQVGPATTRRRSRCTIPDEPPLAGSLLWARHGKGTFVYTGLAFFRQLPAGVPGAYRLFANLLAGGKATHGH